MNASGNLVKTVNAKSSSAKKGLTFTAEQLKQWHWNEGKSLKAISQMFGVSVPAIAYWFQKFNIEHRSNLQTVLFEPSPALSYVIGVILGDGCVYFSKARKNQWTIRLQVIDKVFAESFAKAMRLIGINCGICEIKKSNPKWSNAFLVSGNSRTFGEWWSSMSLDEKLEFASDYPDCFVRGFYESEGTIKFHHGRLELSMCNTNETLARFALNCIPQQIRTSFLRFKSSVIGNKDRYDICINNQLDIKRFLAWVMPCMKVLPRGYANTVPSRTGDSAEGVENTKATQNGKRVGSILETK